LKGFLMTKVKFIGPPGTGKTEKLKEIVKQKLAQGYSINDIIYTSYTNAAADEAATRVMKDLGIVERPMWFRTEHSCCFRLLQLDRTKVFNHRWLARFSDEYPMYKFSWQELDVEMPDSESRFNEVMLKTMADCAEFLYGLMYNTGKNATEVYRKFTKVSDIPDELTMDSFLTYIERKNRFKEENGLITYPDMINRVVEQDLYPTYPRMPKILISDESQDMSPNQWRLIRQWARYADEVYIAGDYLQSIYQFQGAEPEMFLSFPADEEVLQQSFRLTAPVKDYSLKIVSRSGFPIPSFNACDRIGEVKQQSYYSLDWNSIGRSFVLCRTRWLLKQIKIDLIDQVIPFICERGGDSLINTKKGYAYRCLLKVENGDAVSSEELQALMEYTGKPFIQHGTKTRVRQLLEGNYMSDDLSLLGFTSEFFSHLKHPDDILVRHFEPEERRYLAQIYSKYGPNVKPEVTLTTMHGSKGRERPTVVLDPDMTRITWNGYHSDPIPEVLLNYVAATRARDRLLLLYPRERYSYPLPRLMRE
jgi:superfamily I DNA/RNA helicase